MDINYERLREYFRQIKPQTEATVLHELINTAIIKRKKLKILFDKFKYSITELHKILKEIKLFYPVVFKKEYLKNLNTSVIGVDGSFVVMEGFSNDRYIIWSAVAIHVEEKGAKIIQQAQDIKDVYLREVRPNEFRLTSRTGIILSDIFEPPEELKYEFSLKRLGEIIMLEGEKSVLDKLAYSMETPSVIFIDGPIVDPPTYTEKDYIKKRCDTIKLLLERKNIIIGCVKRIRERYLLDTLEGEVNKKVLESLPNDQHLILSIFTKERTITNEERPLATNVFRIGEDNKIYKMYEENGIKVYSFFYENDKKSPVLRFDIPVLSDEGNMEKIVKKNILPFIVKWSYPNLPSPLPVELAHQKCKLEKDSTEILYEEMITSKRILPREFQILFEKMRM